MVLRGQVKYPTWLSLIVSAFIGTIGIHLGGGFMTLSLGVYLVLIVGAAFVFWEKRAAYWITGINAFFYMALTYLELTRIVEPNNSSFIEIYDLQTQPRLIFANIFFGILLLIITAIISGGTAENLGNWNAYLSKKIKENTAELEKLLAEKEKTYHAIVTTLANVIEVRDQYTSDHSHRIVTLAVETARFLNYDEESLERVRLAAILHDIGKIGVPDEILNKPDRLTEEELAIIQRHPDIGADIISTIDDMQDIAEIIRAHQEKYDGSGYPLGLRKKEIPKIARIITVVDAYIAMTDERPYQEAKSKAYAMKELIEQSGSHFDPQVVDAFLYALQLDGKAR